MLGLYLEFDEDYQCNFTSSQQHVKGKYLTGSWADIWLAKPLNQWVALIPLQTS